MSKYKNIITWALKIAVGLGSFGLIYWRLKDDMSAEKLELLSGLFSASSSVLPISICLLFIPLNWGIESYKWQMVTRPIEQISLGKAMRSVYSGVCVGNLAPGRATEFLAKILFFKPENRPTITMLHFANGMFQLSVTIIAGIISLIIRLGEGRSEGQSIFYFSLLFAAFLLILFSLIVFNFNKVQLWIMKRFKKNTEEQTHTFHFNSSLVIKLLGWSVIRYCVFSSQLFLIIHLFYHGANSLQLFSGIGVYFLLTTALPMVSIIEPAIRAAIALLVFGGFGIPGAGIVIIALLLWLVNIVIPSVIGYLIILQEKFEFNLFKR